MESAPSIAILGGTFDPPHIGHLILAECARAQFGLDRVLFIPAGDPYHKTSQGVTAARHRVAMVRAALAGREDEKAFVLDDREVRRDRPSYTVETLDELALEGHTRPLLLLGADALADLPNWRRPERIIELARVVVARRHGDPAARPGYESVDLPELQVSSSELRARVAAGKPIRYLVPDAVLAYISAHGLYRPRDLAGASRE